MFQNIIVLTQQVLLFDDIYSNIDKLSLILKNDLQYLKVRSFIEEFYAKNVSSEYVYHNLEHTSKVVEAAEIIGQKSLLDEESMRVVLLASWFHDTGYHLGKEDHEEGSVEIMRTYLSKENFSEELLKRIEGCILATKLPHNPQNLEEKVMVDADLYHLSSYTYFSDWELMKCEYEMIHKEDVDLLKWTESNINFFKDHRYFTEYGQQVLEPEKEKNLKSIKIRLKWIGKKDNKIEKLQKKLDKMTEKSSDELKPDKARETMLRITSKNHLELSTMADSKANIMISINAIILSIVVSMLIRKLEENPYLLIPTLILIVVCLLTIVFAVLATRPNLSSGKFDEKDVTSKKTNLLFFGNYHKMSLENYMWGMKEMLKDPDYLYGSMIKDIYSLGVILGRKYFLLRIAYTIFMFGFVIAVLSFLMAFIFRNV